MNVQAAKALPGFGPTTSQLWVKNPRENATLPLAVEPWGTQLYLLPDQSYLVVSEFETPSESEPVSIEADEELTVWPRGTKSNRIYREDGNVVWDDARPSDVYRHLTDDVIAYTLTVVREHPRLGFDQLEVALQLAAASMQPARADLAYLLVEHGLLRLKSDGTLISPRPPR
jgi:hypothetical protein